MRALVLYESMFGNTQQVAEAIAEGLRATCEVEVEEISTAARAVDDGVDLLVVGGPTHAFGLSRDSTRASAANETSDPLVTGGPGLREWLAHARVPGHTSAAAFDTRVDKPVPGSAAAAARRRLQRMGLRVAAPAETFRVGGLTGPLLEGELERARRWGEQLAARTAREPA
jgi:hypothetical protein